MFSSTHSMVNQYNRMMKSGQDFVEEGLEDFGKINPNEVDDYKIHYKKLQDYLNSFFSNEDKIQLLLNSILMKANVLNQLIQDKQSTHDTLNQLRDAIKIFSENAFPITNAMVYCNLWISRRLRFANKSHLYNLYEIQRQIDREFWAISSLDHLIQQEFQRIQDVINKKEKTEEEVTEEESVNTDAIQSLINRINESKLEYNLVKILQDIKMLI